VEIKASIEHGRVPVTVIHVTGNIDSTTYEIFTIKINEVILSGTRRILIDLSLVPFISSSGLRALHGIIKKLHTLDPDTELTEAEYKKKIGTGMYKSPHIKLLNLSKEAHTAFTLSGFDIFIEEFTDIAKAIASFYAGGCFCYEEHIWYPF
jgi:anti-anti-sigma factor